MQLVSLPIKSPHDSNVPSASDARRLGRQACCVLWVEVRDGASQWEPFFGNSGKKHGSFFFFGFFRRRLKKKEETLARRAKEEKESGIPIVQAQLIEFHPRSTSRTDRTRRSGWEFDSFKGKKKERRGLTCFDVGD
jgi:hypothetical protein